MMLMHCNELDDFDFFNSWIALPFTFCITTFCVLIYCVEFRLDFVVNFVPHLIDVDPPYSNQTIHYYGYLQCPMCCNVKNPEAKEEQANGWFASVSSITFEDSLDKDACSRYAVSLAPLLITLLRLVWLRVCTLYLRAFRSRVRLNIANEPAYAFSERASCIQIDDFSPLSCLSESQLLE